MLLSVGAHSISARGILPKNQKYRAVPHIRETAR
nr:MAG TPA: hypothetical protein [Caudoviricetes sp.]